MTVGELITKLQQLPPDAEIEAYPEGESPRTVHAIFLCASNGSGSYRVVIE